MWFPEGLLDIPFTYDLYVFEPYFLDIFKSSCTVLPKIWWYIFYTFLCASNMFPENFNVYFYFPEDIKCLTFFAGLQTMLWRRGHQPWRKNIGRQVFRVRSQVECERLYATIPLWSFLRLLEIEGAGMIYESLFQ